MIKIKPIVLVTGSNKRLGKTIAIELAKSSDTVIVASRSCKGAANVVDEIKEFGANSYMVNIDVTQQASVSNAIRTIIARSGRLDVLINNVGNMLDKPILDVSFEEWNNDLSSNLTSAFLMCKEVIPHMIANNWGRIINITDAKACELKASLNTTAYNIAKTGLIILTKSLAKACGEHNITINSIAPGVLCDSIIKPDVREICKKRYSRPADIVSAIRYFLSPESEYTTGANLEVTGGFNL